MSQKVKIGPKETQGKKVAKELKDEKKKDSKDKPSGDKDDVSSTSSIVDKLRTGGVMGLVNMKKARKGWGGANMRTKKNYMDQISDSFFSVLGSKSNDNFFEVDISSNMQPFEGMIGLVPDQKDSIRNRMITQERKRLQEIILIRRYNQVRDNAGSLERRARTQLKTSTVFPEANWKFLQGIILLGMFDVFYSSICSLFPPALANNQITRYISTNQQVFYFVYWIPTILHLLIVACSYQSPGKRQWTSSAFFGFGTLLIHLICLALLILEIVNEEQNPTASDYTSIIIWALEMPICFGVAFLQYKVTKLEETFFMMSTDSTNYIDLMHMPESGESRQQRWFQQIVLTDYITRIRKEAPEPELNSRKKLLKGLQNFYDDKVHIGKVKMDQEKNHDRAFNELKYKIPIQNSSQVYHGLTGIVQRQPTKPEMPQMEYDYTFLPFYIKKDRQKEKERLDADEKKRQEAHKAKYGVYQHQVGLLPEDQANYKYQHPETLV